jgi:DNA-binding protein HU
MKAKRDIYEPMAVELGLTKKASKDAVDFVFRKIAEYLSEGEHVRIDGYGTFEVRNRAERKGRNPQTGKALTIKARKVPAFKAGKGLKDKVNA